MSRKGARRRHAIRKATAAARGTQRLDAEQRQALAVAEQAVARAQADNFSKQPRFDPAVKADVFYSDVSRWLTYADLQEPAYSPASGTRDQWLRKFWRLEPHLAGVMNSVVALDKNRGWSLTGGRNQVYRVTDIFHNAVAAPGLYGWRNFISSQALSYYATDMGTVTEVGRQGRFGPLRELYHTDSARCRLTGSPEVPLEYSPSIGAPRGNAKIPFPLDSFFRVVSMPSDDEAYNGLGFCALSRVLELAKLMVAIYRKDTEMLGARMPEGLLLLRGITQESWDMAMAEREAALDSKERKYFGGVFVLAGTGVDEVDAKLIALRQLPENFDLQVFTDQLMFAYALTFGYSAREFWPVSSGTLGSATEAETQDDNSTGKGESDFILNYQEKLNDELPESILFEFDSRDAKGDAEVLEILKAKASFVDQMSKLSAGGGGTDELGNPIPGGKLLDADQVWALAVEQGIIPEEWSQAEVEATSTDVENDELERWRAAARSNPRVLRALARFPDEPVVRYVYPGEREVVLWEDAASFEARRTWQGMSQLQRASGRVERLAVAIEGASRALQSAPAEATEKEIADMKAVEFMEMLTGLLRGAPAGAGAAAPPILVAGEDGQLTVLRQQVQPVNVTIDTTALADALRSIPQAPSAEALAQAVGAEIARAVPPAPEPFDYDRFAQTLATALQHVPRGPSAAEIARVLARAIPPQPEGFDYERLAAVLAEAFQHLPVPQVSVKMPEQASRFEIEHDAAGRITEIVKTTIR